MRFLGYGKTCLHPSLGTNPHAAEQAPTRPWWLSRCSYRGIRERNLKFHKQYIQIQRQIKYNTQSQSSQKVRNRHPLYPHPKATTEIPLANRPLVSRYIYPRIPLHQPSTTRTPMLHRRTPRSKRLSAPIAHRQTPTRPANNIPRLTRAYHTNAPCRNFVRFVHSSA